MPEDFSNNKNPLVSEESVEGKDEKEKDAVPIESEPQKTIEDELRATTEELLTTKDRLLRLAAEFDNYKKIAQREQQNSIKFANENLILNLLPIVDNLEQAVMAGKKSTESKNDLLIGVEMVLRQFLESLQKYGLEVFSAYGLPFDPTRHEAVSEEISEDKEPGTVIVEYQKGYLLNGRLLRPARVAVSKTSKG